MEKTVVKRPSRSEVSEQSTWKLEDLFATYQDFEAAIEKVLTDLPTVTQFKGKLGENSEQLLKCIKAQEVLQEKVVRIATYANLRISEDGTNPVNQSDSSRIGSVLSKVGAAFSFINSELLSLPDGKIESFLSENDELSTYKKVLEDILASKPYQLHPQTEEALALLSEVHCSPYMIYQRSKSSDMQFQSIVDAQGNEQPVSFALFEDHYELSPDTDLRRKAFESFTSTLKQYKNTYAATYATEINKQVTLSKLRGYDSVTNMLLKPQQVSEEMYINQLDVIQQELAPHMQKFARLKKKVLGLETLRFCDLKAPLDPDFNPSTTYEEASKIILESLQVMGPEYVEIMEKGLSERWVDLPDNIGKSTGAFCASPYGSHPFILMTWTDTMRGAFILAHELGHAGHFYLANKYQTILNTRPSTYFVEAPSTMNELLLGQHILENTTDPRMRRWVILQFLGTYYHNFVTHLLEGELQRRVYRLAEEGKSITATTLCEQKADVLSSFWGDTVEIDEGASLTWMRQPHYYMGLYPYTYSAGLTVSTAVAQLIKEEGQPVVDRWLEVLKAGGTKTPQELINYAGLDMTKPDAIKKAVAYVGTLIEELERSFD
ncbi:oligoendopeptidase F [Bacillus mesophilus]|uniref:Oligopeptidase F n=1 Tax=Bacillus mesophilus TaxID=1808955 RepID=A0A6M0Q8N2_9BACI|nr:oligoendopeptidase F [Bacillus mesophilus]MBM7661926.1 oligoendopeptidase F [Bacillus mesophilus]NEY72715.1 oligoendopeptidase F [Bacillus mesophilus]